jgi:hypothetical protein
MELLLIGILIGMFICAYWKVPEFRSKTNEKFKYFIDWIYGKR